MSTHGHIMAHIIRITEEERDEALAKLSDAELMLVVVEAAIEAGLPISKGSPCHKRMKKILRKLGYKSK